jgi:hypothetical protein
MLLCGSAIGSAMATGNNSEGSNGVVKRCRTGVTGPQGSDFNLKFSCLCKCCIGGVAAAVKDSKIRTSIPRNPSSRSASASTGSSHTPSWMPAYLLACSDSTLQACPAAGAQAELLSEAEMCLRLRNIVDPTQPQALSLRYVLLCSRFTERARHWHGASPKDIKRFCLISCEMERRNQNENHEFSERICHSSCALAA